MPGSGVRASGEKRNRLPPSAVVFTFGLTSEAALGFICKLKPGRSSLGPFATVGDCPR